MSIADSCVRRSDFGSRTWIGLPGRSVAAIEMMLRRASRSGVGAKITSSPACRICLATKRDRTLGFKSSPVFTSTNRTVTGALPVTRLRSSMGRNTHTSLPPKYSNSFFLEALTNSGSSSCPVKSSRKTLSPSICALKTDPLSFVRWERAKPLAPPVPPFLTQACRRKRPCKFRPSVAGSETQLG